MLICQRLACHESTESRGVLPRVRSQAMLGNWSGVETIGMFHLEGPLLIYCNQLVQSAGNLARVGSDRVLGLNLYQQASAITT